MSISKDKLWKALTEPTKKGCHNCKHVSYTKQSQCNLAYGACNQWWASRVQRDWPGSDTVELVGWEYNDK